MFLLNLDGSSGCRIKAFDRSGSWYTHSSMDVRMKIRGNENE